MVIPGWIGAQRAVPARTTMGSISAFARGASPPHFASRLPRHPPALLQPQSGQRRKAIILPGLCVFTLSAGAVYSMKAERNLAADSKVTNPNAPLQSLRPASLPGRRSRLVLSGYVAAIALTTLGWLWLITWIAFRLIQSISGSGQQ